jgi:hypothetical protein
VTHQEIEQGFASAGWELDGSFHEHLIVGYTEELSILAHRQASEADEDDEPESQLFQLCDHENDLEYWVGEIVTPRRASELLREYGEPIIEG